MTAVAWCHEPISSLNHWRNLVVERIQWNLSVLEHLPSSTIQFQPSCSGNKMSQLLNKTSLLDLATLSCRYVSMTKSASQATKERIPFVYRTTLQPGAPLARAVTPSLSFKCYSEVTPKLKHLPLSWRGFLLGVLRGSGHLCTSPTFVCPRSSSPFWFCDGPMPFLVRLYQLISTLRGRNRGRKLMPLVCHVDGKPSSGMLLFHLWANTWHTWLWEGTVVTSSPL